MFIPIIFLRNFGITIRRSTWPFDWGDAVATLVCDTLLFSTKFANSDDVNAVPLSEIMRTGLLYVVKYVLRQLIASFEFVVRTA